VARGLDLCDLDAFVRLDMGPQTDIVSTGDLAHSLSILSDAGFIEQKGRCLQSIHWFEDSILNFSERLLVINTTTF